MIKEDSYWIKTKSKCYKFKPKCIVKKENIFSYKNETKQRWDKVMIICAIFNCFFIPLEIQFELPNLFESVSYIILDNTIDFLFVVDIVIIFFQSYQDPKTGIEVNEPSDVAVNYVQSMGFVYDILSVIGAGVFTKIA